ncbi:hypothetical protein PTTG_02028 [Puccinia triticina 1-1 BBBD Race 1]|uniref:Uncharacterized protein n=1 Tax=Puccinia triticina (isolate 1-1 / race 1 (BBBD)) TaxID=630390 RepID=A0A180GJC5_PUCT1|nr:hypothetical protein PTTG_02028 [Puccinia triticina 1-1 BBBD Race 1]
MHSARSRSAFLLAVLAITQEYSSYPIGALRESSNALGSAPLSAARHEMISGQANRRIRKKAHLVQPRSGQAGTISQQLSQIIGSSPPKDLVPLIELPEPQGPEKLSPPAAEQKPQDKHAPDADHSQGLPPTRHSDSGKGHEQNTQNPPPSIDDTFPAESEDAPNPDGKPQPDGHAKPRGDDQPPPGLRAGPPAQKEDGAEGHPPPPVTDAKGPVAHPVTLPSGAPHPAGDVYAQPGPQGPETAKADRTEIAAIAGIHIERVDTITPASSLAHPPALPGLDVHDGPKDQPLEKDHPPTPPPSSPHNEPKDHLPAPEHGHVVPCKDHLSAKDHPEPKQVELPVGLRITDDSKNGTPGEHGVHAIRITSENLKIELTF